MSCTAGRSCPATPSARAPPHIAAKISHSDVSIFWRDPCSSPPAQWQAAFQNRGWHRGPRHWRSRRTGSSLRVVVGTRSRRSCLPPSAKRSVDSGSGRLPNNTQSATAALEACELVEARWEGREGEDEAGERALHRSEECLGCKAVTLISVTIPSNASVQNCPRAEKCDPVMCSFLRAFQAVRSRGVGDSVEEPKTSPSLRRHRRRCRRRRHSHPYPR